MATGPPTITQLKERFITAQTLLLESPLTPSTTFANGNQRSNARLDPRQLDAVSNILDGMIQDHCRRIFAPQANRALAEQISNSYSKEVERRLDGLDSDTEGISKDVDLLSDETITSLPRTWTSDRAASRSPGEAKQYTEAVDRLAALNDERRELEQRVKHLRRLKTTVEPLQTADGGAGVQENIVTRNGDVEKELERMRTLLVRVESRVGTLPNPLDTKKGHRNEEEGDVRPIPEVRKRNIDDFLADPKVFPSR